MFDLNKYAETLLPYPNHIRVLIIICIVTVFSIFLFYPKRKVGTIDISSLKIAYIEIGENMYQLGIIINVTNLTNKPISVKNICFLGDKIEMNPRGSLKIPVIENTVTPLYVLNSNICSEIIGDSHLKPSESRKYNTLLPLKQNLIIESGFPFEIVFRGDWKVTDTDGQDFIINPRSFGNYDGTFNLSSWNKLTDFETVNKLPPTNEYQGDITIDNYMLYNRDPSAVVRLYGYCNTGYARNKFGTMVFVRGPRTPTLSDGWKILGNSYNDVWSDDEKRKLYNKIVPVDKNTGEPLAFGTFAGIDLGQIRSCPTTRCADVISVHLK